MFRFVKADSNIFGIENSIATLLFTLSQMRFGPQVVRRLKKRYEKKGYPGAER